MFRLSALPAITFVTPDSEETLDLSRCGLKIQRIAGQISRLHPGSAPVALLFPSEPGLVLAWLATLVAGRIPLILQYPNEKASKEYWKASIRDTVERCGVGALICSPNLAGCSLEDVAPCSFLDEIHDETAEIIDFSFPEAGEILQLSSGTTGFRKPIRFTFEALRQHTARYNEALGLSPEDRIASWLPLYHDMGFIACLVMPLMLGVPIVMIDPIIWVRQPRLLCEAIDRHQGTICYMPNFGFEVMAKTCRTDRIGKVPSLRSIRRWISCSEPTYSATLQRFIDATGVAPSAISTCYAMAENVFAVTLSDGMHFLERDGQTYVSCGPAIPGTDILLREGQLLVRSPHSLDAYVGSGDIRDEAGFYATGDLGFIDNGQIFITGRRQDLANIAGKKYLLNDLDFALGQIFTQSAGRIASMSLFDEASGTEKALFLIEAENFWDWERSPEPARLVREATGVEWMEVHFVPPQFITKSSSGKINRRKTLADWQACLSGARLQPEPATKAGLAQELAEYFPGIAPGQPVGEELDSLGQLILRVLCEQHGIEYKPSFTLEGIAAMGRTQREAHGDEIFSIVALVDGWRLGFDAPEPFIDDEFLKAIETVVGMPVHFEHICVPPAIVLLSDLTFHDYFLPRNPDPAYAAVAALLRKIKHASLILVDDEDNFRTPPYCAYPVLDRQFAMDAEADLLGHRMQRYTKFHHLLPRRVVLGKDILPGHVNPLLNHLESYLGTPILKMAFHAEFRAHTEHWDFCDYRDFGTDAEKISNVSWLDRFQEVLLNFIRSRASGFRTSTGEPGNRFVLMDSPHFCSFLLNRAAVDFVVQRYNSFCIVGLSSSLPYLREQLELLGKPFFFSTETVPTREDYECLILTGGVGGRMPVTSKPTYDFVHAREEGHGGGRPHNVPASIAALCPPLAACDQQIFRSLLPKYGVLIGNFLLNHTDTKAKV